MPALPSSPINIRVVSKRCDGTHSEPGESIISIDRTNPILGNRHVMRKPNDARERERVIVAHEKDLDADFARQGPMHQAITDIAERVGSGERVALACWCAPLPCHGDNIIKKIRLLLES